MGKFFPEDPRPLKDRLDFIPNIPRIELALLMFYAATIGIGAGNENWPAAGLSLAGLATSAWLHKRTLNAAEELQKLIDQTPATTDQMPSAEDSRTPEPVELLPR